MPNLEAKVDQLTRKGAQPNSGQPQPAESKANLTPAPDVEMKTLEGQPFHLSSLRGRVVVLNFWATWCLPCRAEIPQFNAMQRELGDKGLTIVGAALDDTTEGVKDFQNDIKQDYTILMGDEAVKQKFQVNNALPITVIIDREGNIRERIIGGRDREGFESVIKPLLDETTATAQIRFVHRKWSEEAPLEN
jgi:cytochrome c biogenesis protein CcmG/thiol:disulfide interchange protein DsbE